MNAQALERIAILSPLKSWGGLERKFTILAEEFLRLGVAVDFLRIRGGQVPYPDHFPAAARIFDLGTRSKFDGVPAVIRYLASETPSVILTAKDHAAQVAVIASMLSRHHVPVFAKVTNMPSEVIRRSGQRFMARRLYPRAAGVIAISRGVREDIVENFRVPSERAHLIYNPMITHDFPQRLARPVEHPWFHDADRLPTILGAGRLTGQKDFSTLLHAFAILRRRRPCRLMILGEGQDRESLESLAASLELGEDFALPGMVNDPVPYMAVASCFALTSRYEGLGNVLVEALASGTRLVSTDCPSGPREILEDGRHGRLVPVGDADALAAEFDRLLDEPRPGIENRRDAIARFHVGSVAQAYLRVMSGGKAGE